MEYPSWTLSQGHALTPALMKSAREKALSTTGNSGYIKKWSQADISFAIQKHMCKQISFQTLILYVQELQPWLQSVSGH